MPTAHTLQEMNVYIFNKTESAHSIPILVWSSYKAKYNLFLNGYSETPVNFIMMSFFKKNIFKKPSQYI